MDLWLKRLALTPFALVGAFIVLALVATAAWALGFVVTAALVVVVVAVYGVRRLRQNRE